MKRRVAIWATVGFLVAGFWALFAFATFPSSQRIREVWPLVNLTCPISIVGMHHAVNLYIALAANAVTYALVGLILEAVRRQMRHGQ